jgi:hypothetical protein
LANRYRNLIFVWKYVNVFAVKEGERKSRFKGTGKVGFDRPLSADQRLGLDWEGEGAGKRHPRTSSERILGQ